jgi:hypothetical protein
VAADLRYPGAACRSVRQHQALELIVVEGVITLSQMWLEILLAPDRHGLTVTEM